MKLGAHISAAGGLHLVPVRAAELGLETFQFFSRSPQGGRAPDLSDGQIASFRAACERGAFAVYYVHAPYVINLASADDRIRTNSVEMLSAELRRCSALGVTAMMTHLGSSAGMERCQGVELAGAALKKIMSGHQGTTRFLVESAAGAGHILGADFREIREILDLTGDERLGVCLDTAHAFASGYDLRTAAAVAGTLDAFDREIGLDRLTVVHFNDSKVGLGARRDRHEHLGDGQIGRDGLRALLNEARLKDIDLILETPNDDVGRRKDVKFLRDRRR